jgi:hypothetical protein
LGMIIFARNFFLSFCKIALRGNSVFGGVFRNRASVNTTFFIIWVWFLVFTKWPQNRQRERVAARISRLSPPPPPQLYLCLNPAHRRLSLPYPKHRLLLLLPKAPERDSILTLRSLISTTLPLELFLWYVNPEEKKKG